MAARFFKGKSWQDWVTTGVNLMFAPSLVPMVMASAPPSLWTSMPTAVGLWVLSFTFWTLKLRLGPVALSVAAFMWSIMVLQGVFKG